MGQNLRKVRIDQNAVAAELGVTLLTFTDWEKVNHNPEVLQMKSVIAFLGFYPLPMPKNLPEQIWKYRQIHRLTL